MLVYSNLKQTEGYSKGDEITLHASPHYNMVIMNSMHAVLYEQYKQYKIKLKLKATIKGKVVKNRSGKKQKKMKREK